MTPEQEDAHWALMGKPLMRHWLARLAELERANHVADEAIELRRRAIAIPDANGERIAHEASAAYYKADQIRQAADNVWWAAIPDNVVICRSAATGSWVVNGVEYKLTDGTDYHLSTNTL